MQIGVQTKNVVYDDNPVMGFEQLKAAGFSCADFSLNSYLLNTSLYRQEKNEFFSQPISELEVFLHRISRAQLQLESILTRCICRIRIMFRERVRS